MGLHERKALKTMLGIRIGYYLDFPGNGIYWGFSFLYLSVNKVHIIYVI